MIVGPVEARDQTYFDGNLSAFDTQEEPFPTILWSCENWGFLL